MKKSSEENKGLLGGIKAFYQTKIGKMTFFFGFYFFFFLFLAFFLKGNIDNSNNTNNNGNSDNSTVNENVNKNPSNELFNTELLINDNYYYKYEVTGDEKCVTFEGRINDKNDLLEEYAYNYFLNIYNIRQIIKNSKYLSREEVEGVVIYNYEVTTSTIILLIPSVPLYSPSCKLIIVLVVTS